MRITQGYKLEGLLLIAFLATVPIYSPNMVLFARGLPFADGLMPWLVYSMLGATALFGALLAGAGAKGKAELLLRAPAVIAGALCYVAGFALCLVALGLEPLALPALALASGVLLGAGTVELALAWGAFMAFSDLKRALFWTAIMFGAASLLQLLLSAVVVAVGIVAFWVLALGAVGLPCWKAVKGKLNNAPADSANEVSLAVEGSASSADSSKATSRAACAEQPLQAGLLTEGAMSFSPAAAGALSASYELLETPGVHPSSPETAGGALWPSLKLMAQVIAVPLIGLFVFAFLTGARKFMLFDVVYAEVLGGIGSALIVAPLGFVKRAQPLLPFIYQVAMPAFALFIIVLNSFPAGTAPLWLGACLTYVFFGAIAVLALSSLCAMAHAGEFSSALIYGVTLCGFGVTSMAGVLCGGLPAFAEQDGGPVLLVVGTVYFAFLLALPLFEGWCRARSGTAEGPAPVSGQSASEDIAAESSPDPVVAAAPRADVSERCAKVAAAYGLSPRETEIFGYLGRGHGVVFIAETLVISESTVRTHVKNIYRKLGIGSREELLALVDAA